MYENVDGKLDFIKNELDVLKFWQEKDIFKKSLAKNQGQKVFSFYEGPPTANGLPHVGHPLTRAMKDVIPRFKTMQGYYVPRMAGWDTHGLPVELEVEKEIGSTGKEDIEKFGLEKFIELCKNNVWKYKKIWEDITARFGYWVDMDKPYVTYDNNYIESVFWALKQMHEKGLIYKGHKIVPYCPRCGTTLSKMEVDKNYKTLKEKSVVVKMKSMEEENTYFLVWTTTPWTLPSNVAICFNPKDTYVKIESQGTNYILMENLVSRFFEDYKVVYKKLGKEFEFQKYEPLFNYVSDKVEKGYFVTVDDYVTTEDGTGIVHIAPAFGQEDYDVGKKYDLSFVQLIDEYGKFTAEATDFVGVPAKQADKVITIKLDNEGKLFKVLNYEHNYPHCWRCETPLLYYAKSTWFVKTTAVKDELIKNNADVNWLPDTIKDGRMGNFLENNIDWGISRNRFWGTPLPFWQCKNGHIHVVGSKAELEKLTGEKDIKDLHKSVLDKLKFKCEVCGEEMERTPEVLDCWFDSGSMPFAQYHYPFENKELFEKTFPADYICEGIDQTRGWFYTLLAVNTILFGKSPYKSCTATGLVNDRYGLKMSKSKGNGINPWDILNKEGSDALRWYFYYTACPGVSMSFNEDNLIELQRKFMGTLWNVYAFYILYAKIDNFDPTKYELKKCELAFIDKWILSEYNSLVKYVTNCLEKYDMLSASRKITNFVDILSNWYVRRSRERFWGSESTGDKISAFKTLYELLKGLTNLIAPFVPFISEKIYQNLVLSVEKNAPESIHLCSYIKADESMIDEVLNEKMEKILDIVYLGRSARNASNIKNRQPLSSAKICSGKKLELSSDLVELIENELNVENIEIVENAFEYVNYIFKPDLKVVGPKYGKKLNAIREYLANLDANSYYESIKNGKAIEFVVLDETISLYENDLLIEVQNKEGYVSESDGSVTVILDTHITTELKEKGIIRELVSKIQNQRKECDFRVEDRISTYIESDDEMISIIKKYNDVVKKDTLTKTLEFKISNENYKAYNIENHDLKIYLER